MRLSLEREALAELTGEDLVLVHGAAAPAPDSLRVRDCFEPLTHPTALDCLTGPCTTGVSP